MSENYEEQRKELIKKIQEEYELDLRQMIISKNIEEQRIKQIIMERKLEEQNLKQIRQKRELEEQKLEQIRLMRNEHKKVTINTKTADEASVFCIRIIEEPLTPHNLTSIISAITDLSTKCLLIANRRFADLIEYVQTHDVRFIEESRLIITKITYNSPFEAHFDISASNIAEAIKTTIDGVKQANVRLKKAELENREKAQEIEHAKEKTDQENKAALLELEKQELANERERLEILEKRLEVQKKGIEYALEIVAKTVNILHPNADEEIKALLMQTLLPTVLQLQNGKGLELVLPVSQKSGEKIVEPENG